MKQGLKIILFVLPQLFALVLKANIGFAGNDIPNSHQNNFHQVHDLHLSNVTVLDGFKDFETELEDEFVSNYSFQTVESPKISTVQKVNFYREFLQNQNSLKLYILYSSLKLHC